MAILAALGKTPAKGMRRMLKAGPGEPHPDGSTALHIAAQSGHIKTVEAMVALPMVDTQARDRFGHTPFDRARIVTKGAYDAALTPLLEAAPQKAEGLKVMELTA